MIQISSAQGYLINKHDILLSCPRNPKAQNAPMTPGIMHHTLTHLWLKSLGPLLVLGKVPLLGMDMDVLPFLRIVSGKNGEGDSRAITVYFNETHDMEYAARRRWWGGSEGFAEVGSELGEVQRHLLGVWKNEA